MMKTAMHLLKRCEFVMGARPLVCRPQQASCEIGLCRSGRCARVAGPGGGLCAAVPGLASGEVN